MLPWVRTALANWLVMLLSVVGAPAFLTHTKGTTPTSPLAGSPLQPTSAGVVSVFDIGPAEAWNESAIAMLGKPALSAAAGATGVSKVAGTLFVPGGADVGVESTKNPATMAGLAVASGRPLPVVKLWIPPTEPDHAVLMVTAMFEVTVVPLKMASVAPRTFAPAPVYPMVNPGCRMFWIAVWTAVRNAVEPVIRISICADAICAAAMTNKLARINLEVFMLI